MNKILLTCRPPIHTLAARKDHLAKRAPDQSIDLGRRFGYRTLHRLGKTLGFVVRSPNVRGCDTR
jgi:hypothetical protein